MKIRTATRKEQKVVPVTVDEHTKKFVSVERLLVLLKDRRIKIPSHSQDLLDELREYGTKPEP